MFETILGTQSVGHREPSAAQPQPNRRAVIAPQIAQMGTDVVGGFHVIISANLDHPADSGLRRCRTDWIRVRNLWNLEFAGSLDLVTKGIEDIHEWTSVCFVFPLCVSVPLWFMPE